MNIVSNKVKDALHDDLIEDIEWWNESLRAPWDEIQAILGFFHELNQILVGEVGELIGNSKSVEGWNMEWQSDT